MMLKPKNDSFKPVTSRKAMDELLSELFERQGRGWFRIISGSMAPLIEVDERVLVRREKEDEIGSGDVIMFRDRGLFVTHRVVGRFYRNGRLYFMQKGDRGGSAGAVPAENVLGKIIAIEKNGRLLRLDRGWGRMAGSLFGTYNRALYYIGGKTGVIKAGLKEKPGFQLFRYLYRIIKRPFVLLNMGLARIFMAGICKASICEPLPPEIRGKEEAGENGI